VQRNKWGRNFTLGKHLGISLGWFSGNEFIAFEFVAGHIMDGLVSIVGLRIAKFTFEVTWEK
jgi:hypothetical protein